MVGAFSSTAKKADGRNGAVDIFRLLYAIVIMTGHLVTVGMVAPFPFAPVGILVEFFLFLTGYFTCVSFLRKASEPTDYFSNGLKYTLKKFKPLVPYLVVSVGLSYSINIIFEIQNGGGIAQLGRIAYHMFSEMFLLSYVFAEIGQRVGALFYLAALLVVFPAFCMLTQIKNKSIKFAVALYAMVFYYYDTDAVVTATYPQVLFRVMCGLCTGMILYYLVQMMREKGWKGRGSIGIVLLTIPLMLSGLQMLDRRIALFCEFIGLALLLADRKFEKNNSITDFAAKMSMIVYILHWSIGQNISFYLANKGIQIKLVLYYAVTITVSAVLYLIFEKARRQRGLRP